MNSRETMATVERPRKLFSDGGQMPGMASELNVENDSYPEGSKAADEPFFASNLIYYPELPQPYTVCPYQSYRNWKIFKDPLESMQTQTRPEYPEHGKQQPINAESELWQQLGQNVCLWTQQPVTSLAKMNGVELACVLLATHLIKQRRALNENCILTHFNSNELRSYLVQNEEIRDVLHRCEQRERASNLMQQQKAVPKPKPKPKPKQRQQRIQKEQAKRTADSVNDGLINPSLGVIQMWEPETACYNYKLQSL